MRNKIILVLCFFSFFSCNKGKVKAVLTSDTLKSEVSLMIENTQWAKEIEKERLLRDVSIIPEISEDVSLSPISIITANIKTPSIYPELEGIGKLSMEGVDGKLKDFLHKVCINLQGGKLDVKDFKEGYEFKMEFFYSDFERLYSETTKKLSLKDLRFQGFFAAKPRKTESGYTAKVRFYNGKHVVDVEFWILKTEQGYKIFDLALLRFV